MMLRPPASTPASASPPVADRRSEAAGAWDLVSGAHPERLAACLRVPLSATTLRRLQDSQRLRPRLQTLLAENVQLSGCAEGLGTHEDGALADVLLAWPDLPEVARMAGAVWHARGLKLLVSGAAVSELVRRIGRRAHSLGLRKISYSVETSPAADPIALATSIERDGLLCLGAYSTAAGGGVRGRILAKLPPGTPAEALSYDDTYLRHAPMILTQVAAELREPHHGF